MSKAKNTSPASSAEVRAWAREHVSALEKAEVSTAFLNPPSGKVRGRVPEGARVLFTKATGRPAAEKSVAEGKSVDLTLTRRDKNGRSRGKVTESFPIAEVRALAGPVVEQDRDALTRKALRHGRAHPPGAEDRDRRLHHAPRPSTGSPRTARPTGSG